MQPENFKNYFALSLFALAGCATGDRPLPMEACIVEAQSLTLDCARADGAPIIRKVTEVGNYVCFKPDEFKIYQEACHKK
jgi:hypothetical protein